MTTEKAIDDRVLTIAETAWSLVKDRNGYISADPHFETFVYEQTTEFLIALDESFKTSARPNIGFKLASSWDGGSFLTEWDAGSFETADEAQAEADRFNRHMPYEDSSIVVVRSDGTWPDGTPANWDEPEGHDV